LARHESEFRAAAKGPLSLDELLALLGDSKAESNRERQEAITCYLAAGEGWNDAVQRLGGAFAPEQTGLTERKSD
jgi:hypothetical protein